MDPSCESVSHDGILPLHKVDRGVFVGIWFEDGY